jgi:hypothetical protein
MSVIPAQAGIQYSLVVIPTKAGIQYSLVVIPAKAGIQYSCALWIPASAGSHMILRNTNLHESKIFLRAMRVSKMKMDSSFRWNDSYV